MNFDSNTGKPLAKFDSVTGQRLETAAAPVLSARPGDHKLDPDGGIDPTTARQRTIPVETAELYAMLKAQLASEVQDGNPVVANAANRLLILCEVLDHSGIDTPLAGPSRAENKAA